MKLHVVSNRLPFTVERQARLLSFKASAGGLASGLTSFLGNADLAHLGADEHLWIGWPGAAVTGKTRDAVMATARELYGAHPVFLTAERMDRFYHGFCNQVLWPLFHYFPSYCHYAEDDWQEYQSVNRAFADTVLEVADRGDIVWVQDYHLMLLPGMLRGRAGGDLRIGFFLHIPFPAFEVFRLLPGRWRSALIEGLLGADLIGFHTEDYRRHFVEAAIRIADATPGDDGVSLALGGHTARTGAFPMGIDVEHFASARKRPEVREEIARLKRSLNGRRGMLSLDRLDYSKGIVNRLHGYERFLERYPDYQGQVDLLMIVIPSRVAVQHYGQLKTQIEQTVGRINGRFGRMDWMPINYQYRSLEFPELAGVYAACDAALITPLRDGMNLVAKEYVASRAGGPGVLILSEFAGAAHELQGALLVNPNSTEELATAIAGALGMPAREQILRNRRMLEGLRAHDVAGWATGFLEQLRAPPRRRRRASAPSPAAPDGAV